MQLRWLLMLTLILTQQSWSAEIYTFGKRGDGTRYVRNIDRPQRKEAEESADKSTPATSPKPPVPRPLQTPRNSLPPPIPDAQKLRVLEQPI